MEEAGCEVILNEVVDAEVTAICKKEVKLQLQRIRRDGHIHATSPLATTSYSSQLMQLLSISI